MSILEEIYSSRYFPIEIIGPQLPRELREKQKNFYDEAEKAIGADLFEKYWDELCEANRLEDYLIFREGFRLGVSLALELL